MTAKDNRLFVEAMLYGYRAGIPWRDLPERFGDHKQVHTQFSRWARNGAWERIFRHLAADADDEAIGRSRGGLSTKSHATVTALGNPTGCALLPGQAHDLEGADALMTDKALDAEERELEPLEAAGRTAVIPPKGNRKAPRPCDKDLYQARHLIETFFAKLQQFQAMATRYAKQAANLLAAIHFAATIWLN